MSVALSRPTGMVMIGEDAARAPLGRTDVRREPLFLALVLFGVTWAAFAVLALLGTTAFRDASSGRLAELINASTAVLALVVSGLCLMRWRLIGDTGALWVGAALLVYGGLKVGVGELLLPLDSTDAFTARAADVVGASALVTAVIFLVLAVRDAPPRWRRGEVMVVGGIAGLLLLAGVFRVVPGVADALARPADGTDGSLAGHVVVVGVWLALGAVYLRRGLGRRDPSLNVWLALVLLGLAQSRAVLAFVDHGEIWTTASQFFRLLAMLFALLGCNRELQRAFVRQREQLLESLRAVELSETRRAEERAAVEERAHDVRSALLAIDGAARTLERYHDRLPPEDRTMLAHAMSSEVARLQQLVVVEEPEVVEEDGSFDVADSLLSLVVVERSRGASIGFDVPDGLLAVGNANKTVQVVRTLLDNAARYAPGSPVHIRAERREDWVAVFVEDRGPGVSRADRRHIFERGRRGTGVTANGQGLGLFVATRLMEEQGGRLWVEDRRGGGASFGLSLRVKREVIE